MTTPSKAKILSKIRKGLNKTDYISNAPKDTGDIFVSIDEDLIVAFAKNFNKTAGQLIYCSKKEDFYDKLFEYKKKQELENVYCWGDELSQNISDAGIEIIKSKENFIQNCDAGITLCESLVTRTGSILVSSALGGGRELSIYPPIHIVVGYTSQIVAEVGDALNKVKNTYDKMPSMISLTSGPSRTADIEKTLVMGAHGPKELVLFLIDDSQD